MRGLLFVVLCGVLLPSFLSPALVPAVHGSDDGIAAAVADSSGQTGPVTLAAAPTAVSPPVDVPDASTTSALARSAKSPHISDETPLRQALAPQKSQTPDGTSVCLDEPESKADPASQPR
jgi:hypothetical protein